MNRKVLWSVLVIGAALVIAPFALSLPGKSAAGERMLGDFQPIMQPKQVQTTAYYYNDVFTPLGKVVPAMSAANVAKFEAYVQGMKGVRLTPAQMQSMQRQFPQLAQLFGGMPTMLKDFDQLIALMKANENIFAQVPAGLAHYQPLVTTMQGNVQDYKQVNSLPDFRLFTWFFVIPGLLLVLLASIGLAQGRKLRAPSVHLRPTHV
jgi:hypothetical protein